MEPIIDLLLGYLIRKGIEFAWRFIIRHVNRKIKARRASKSGYKSGMDYSTGATTTYSDNTYSYNVHYRAADQ